MTNREKYKLTSKMILKNTTEDGRWYCKFVKEHVLKKDCTDIPCGVCNSLFLLWLDEDAEEDAVDWSKVEPGTLIEVSDNNDFEEIPSIRRFIAEYNGKVITENKYGSITLWNYGRLLKDGDKHD